MVQKRLVIYLPFALLLSFLAFSQNAADKYAKKITAKDLKRLLYVYASDGFQGREYGTKGEAEALKFLQAYYVRQGIPPANTRNATYLQNTTGDTFFNSNVIAYIKGSEKPDEYIYVSAHLDHIGVSPNGEINNGADDDGSGTVAVMEIADAFQKAKQSGFGPKRSVVFLHATGEEKGLLGSQYYTDNPIFPLDQAVADLNIDMIGRTDPDRQGSKNYIYLIGSDKLSTDLHKISENVNKSCCNLELDYKFNDERDPNRFYYRSDHYNFAKNNVPVIFYFNGVHEDYHQPTDTPDKIDYELLAKRAKLIFYTAWELANREDRIFVDKRND